MNYDKLRAMCVALLVSSTAVPAHALIIDLTFGAGFENDVQRGVVTAAADWWEQAILTDFTVSITARQVDLTPKGATLLGAMSSNTEMANPDPVTGTRLPVSGVVDLAANRLDDFFFDATPEDSAEFDMNRRGGTVGDAIAGSDAEGLFDALSVWKHEIGHVLGFSGGTGNWADGDPFLGYTDFMNNLTGDTYTFDWLSGGLEGNNGDTLELFNIFHTDEAVIESLMNPTFGRGERRLQTPIDIDIIADAFHLEFNDQPHLVPEPPVLLLLLVGLLGLGIGARARRV